MPLLASSLWFGFFFLFFLLFYFSPGLGIGSAGLSYFFFHIRPRCVPSLERKIREDGFALAGVFGVWSSWGFFVFVFYYCTVYTLLHNKYVLSVPLPEQSSYLVFLSICVHTFFHRQCSSFILTCFRGTGLADTRLGFCDGLLFGIGMRGGRSVHVVMCWLGLFVIFFFGRWGLGGGSSI